MIEQNIIEWIELGDSIQKVEIYSEKNKKLFAAVGEGFDGVYSHTHGKALLFVSQKGLLSKNNNLIISFKISITISIII